MTIPPEALASLRNGSPPDEQDTPPPGYGLTIPVMASTLLEVVVEHARAAGMAVPERRVVAAGSPREIGWDSEQITVTLAGIGWGSAPGGGGPVQPQELSRTMRHVVFEVAWVRRGVTADPGMSATPTMPTREHVHKVGLGAMQAAGVLSEAVLQTAMRLERGLVNDGCLVQTGTVEIVGPTGQTYALISGLTVTIGE